MTPNTGSYEVHSEPRGPHWVAWLIRPGSQKSDRSIVVIGETQEEAEARARRFAEHSPY